MYRARGIDVVIAETILDERFLQMLEQLEGIKFVRVDADTSALRDEEVSSEENEKLTALFSQLSTDEMKLSVKAEKLLDESVPAVLTVSEESRRMEEMMKMYAPDMPFNSKEATLVLNTASPLVTRLAEGGFGDRESKVAKHIYALATLSHRPFNAEEMKAFLADSYEILSLLK